MFVEVDYVSPSRKMRISGCNSLKILLELEVDIEHDEFFQVLWKLFVEQRHDVEQVLGVLQGWQHGGSSIL